MPAAFPEGVMAETGLNNLAALDRLAFDEREGVPVSMAQPRLRKGLLWL